MYHDVHMRSFPLLTEKVPGGHNTSSESNPKNKIEISEANHLAEIGWLLQ